MHSRDLITRFYRQHRGRLLAFVSSRLGGDIMTAEDMVQEVFLRLLSDDRRAIIQDALPGLVYTMASRLITDHCRHRRQQHLYEQRHSLSAYAEDVMPAIYVSDTVAHIERRLARLPQPCAQVYRLHLYSGMKAADISRHLGMDYKAVEYRLGQARREVRRLLRTS